MVLAVDERDAEVDHRVARKHAALGGLLDALLDRRAVVLRDRAAEDLVHELETAALRERFDVDDADAELAASAGLFLVLAFDVLDLLLDRLEVGHLRRVQDRLDAELALHLRQRDLDVNLARARDEQLGGLRVAADAQDRIFLGQARQGRRDLLFVAFGLGFDGVGDGRFSERDRRVLDRRSGIAQRVGGQRFFELGHHADVAGVQLADHRKVLALRDVKLPQPLRRVSTTDVDHAAVALENA